jgi:polyisoprenoid-binding protein YceI
MAISSTARVGRCPVRHACGILAFIAILVASPSSLAQGQAQPSNPANSPAAKQPAPTEPARVAASGKSLIIPDTIKAKGAAYHAQPGGPRQISFLSDAPFEKISGHTNAVLGYAIAGPEADPAHLQAGEWHLPVTSLRTGNAERDTHLTRPEWLDAAKFPDIVFRLRDVQNIKPLAGMKDPSLRAYTVTLLGDLTIHGVTRELAITDATIRFRSRNPKAGTPGEGDFLFVSWKQSIQLSDFGVTHPQITGSKKVSNTIEIDAQLALATVPPEEQPQRQASPTERPGSDARSKDAMPKTETRN